MSSEQQFTVDDLRRLAESRNYSLVKKADHFWLINRKDRLPAVNHSQHSLLFSAAEARAMLEELSLGADRPRQP